VLFGPDEADGFSILPDLPHPALVLFVAVLSIAADDAVFLSGVFHGVRVMVASR
jgi:hypothetical protein